MPQATLSAFERLCWFLALHWVPPVRGGGVGVVGASGYGVVQERGEQLVVSPKLGKKVMRDAELGFMGWS